MTRLRLVHKNPSGEPHGTLADAPPEPAVDVGTDGVTASSPEGEILADLIHDCTAAAVRLEALARRLRDPSA